MLEILRTLLFFYTKYAEFLHKSNDCQCHKLAFCAKCSQYLVIRQAEWFSKFGSYWWLVR